MTIAFSEKFNSWTTRYSFEPTCYSTTGNRMVSFNDNGDVWLHDSNEQRCNFYGGASGASIEVVSNQDPSAVKMFKSLSLETNASGWSGNVYTNDEYGIGGRQEGDILESFFKDKEGFKYSEMPRSKVNSSVVQTVGKLKAFPYEGADTASYSTLIGDYFLQGLNDQNISYGNIIADTWSGVNIESGSAVVVEDPIFYFELPAVLATDLITPGSTPVVHNDDGTLTPANELKISGAGFAPSLLNLTNTRTVRFSCKINDFEVGNIGGGGIVLPIGLVSYIIDNFYDYPTNPSLPSAAWNGKNLLSEVNSEVNGDQMRGPYARIKLNTLTTDSFELHAINVDYEFSKLDKRLTQNS